MTATFKLFLLMMRRRDDDASGGSAAPGRGISAGLLLLIEGTGVYGGTYVSDGWVFILRHGKHEDGQLDTDAVKRVVGVANRFAEWLHGELRHGGPPCIEIMLTSSPEVQQTARLVHHELKRVLPDLRTGSREGAPTASVTAAWTVPNQADEFVDRAYIPDWQEHDERAIGAYGAEAEALHSICRRIDQSVKIGGTSVLVVGNDPFVGWLAAELTGRVVPVARGELICLERRDRPRRPRVERPWSQEWRLAWNIVSEPGGLQEEISAKIKAKMESAKALGAVVVALLTYLLTRGLTDLPSLSPLTWASAAALGLAAWLYIGSLFLYDGLLMPARFWGSRLARRRDRLGGARGVRRPPGSTERVLVDAMVHVWSWVFLPATLLVGVGVALLAAGAAERAGAAGALAPALNPWAIGLGCVGLAAAATGWVWWHRPQLGTSD